MLIYSAVDIAKHATRGMGRFTRWGPSAFGLSIILLLPLYLDEPVEHSLEWSFEKYGPWAGSNTKSDGLNKEKEH